MDKKDYIHIQKNIDGILDNGERIEYIHGVLTAILCAPEIIPPSVWLPLLLHKDDEEFVFKSADDANALIGPLMELYNDIANSLANNGFYPLYDHRKVPGKGQLRADPETARLWCRGFVGGLGLWRTDFVADDKAREILMPVFLIVDSGGLLEENPGLPIETVKQLEKNSVSAIAETVAMIREYYLKKPKTVTARVGRNEPCPCGSGKKYKKCCGAN
jgi:uncharacterized protein